MVAALVIGHIPGGRAALAWSRAAVLVSWSLLAARCSGCIYLFACSIAHRPCCLYCVVMHV